MQWDPVVVIIENPHSGEGNDDRSTTSVAEADEGDDSTPSVDSNVETGDQNPGGLAEGHEDVAGGMNGSGSGLLRRFTTGIPVPRGGGLRARSRRGM